MIKLLVVFLMGFLLLQQANATSGRTNLSGCHNSKKVGYHCHGTSKSSSYKPKKSTYVTPIRGAASYYSSNTNDDIQNLVKNIQLQLNALGYKAGQADGILGKNTISAIKSYQRKNRLLITGKPSKGLLAKLILANS